MQKKYIRPTINTIRTCPSWLLAASGPEVKDEYSEQEQLGKQSTTLSDVDDLPSDVNLWE